MTAPMDLTDDERETLNDALELDHRQLRDALRDFAQKLSDARIEAKRLISERGNKQSTLDALVKAVETATAAEIVRLKGMLFGDLSEHDKLMSQINKQGGK